MGNSVDIGLPSKEGLKCFFYWINERHAIHIRRHVEKRPFPWTEDPILQKYKFCEVFRELDRVTIWIRENWREPYADHKNLAFAMAMARQINWPDTLAEIGFPKRWDPDRVCKILRARAVRGEKTYTSAYMLTGTLGGDKPGQTTYKILDPLYRDPPKLKPGMSLEEAFGLYIKRPGFGPFMTYEVISDLRYTRYLRDAPDIMTWANPGPGALRGLCRVWGLKIKGRRRRDRETITRSKAIEMMRYLLKVSPKYLGKHVPALDMRAIEHVCCEADKYERVRLGEGSLERYRQQQSVLL